VKEAKRARIYGPAGGLLPARQPALVAAAAAAAAAAARGAAASSEWLWSWSPFSEREE